MPLAFEPHAHRAIYLTEGDTETELMYRHGLTFDHFAAFTLLEDKAATQVVRGMYRQYLDRVAESGHALLLAGLDYRSSPDWGDLLGYSCDGLAEMVARNIAFLREVSAPYAGQIPDIRIAGGLGPRGDAYGTGGAITADEAQEYHAWQIGEFAKLEVDIVWAATINNIPEAVGIARAAADAGLPLNLCFTLASDHRLRSGSSLREAVEETDRQSGAALPDGYGINCSHPVEFLPALDGGAWQARLRNIRPNAAAMDKIALCKLNHLEEGNPEELGAQMGALARQLPSVDIWGGCCGTWDKHIPLIAQAVGDARRPATA